MHTRSLLICGAHPDDETFYAGTMAKYVAEGARVSIVCGTRGERGSTADLCTIEELPALREQELRSSMACLGLAPEAVYFLPYEDQKLGQAPLEDARKEMVRIIRATKPQVVVTFDLQGANGHTDHVAISRLTSESLAAAADARWHPAAGSAWQVQRLLWSPVFRPWTIAPNIDLRGEPGVDFLIDTEPWTEQKTAAIRAHRTQFPGLGTLYFEKNSPQLTLHSEAFRLAWGPRPTSVPATDLFA